MTASAPLDQTPVSSAVRLGQREIESLVALFAQPRYAEAETQARMLTFRFPHDGFGWKALGAVLKQLGRSAEAIAPYSAPQTSWLKMQNHTTTSATPC